MPTRGGPDTAGMREALRQALHRDVCDALPEGGVTCDDIADALLPVVQRLAVEKAAEATTAVRELAEHSVDGTVSAGAVLRALAAAAQPTDGRTGE